MITIENLSAGYADTPVLHNLSLHIPQGQRLSIIGPNGCGKTTLLKVLARLLPCSAGRVLLQGKDIACLSRANIGNQLAMMAQISDIYFPYTVFEAVQMGCYLHGKSKAFSQNGKQTTQLVQQCLQAVGMLQSQNRSLFQLSGGQLQRVFLARAFAQTPRILLLDEPTNHLDLKNQIELFNYVHHWATSTGGVVVQVLHDINLAAGFSDRILLMHQGRIQALGTPNQVLRRSKLKEVYQFDVSGYMQNALQQWKDLDDEPV